MTSLYPSSILSITNPTANNTLNSPSHSNQHATENDNIVAIETKLGVDQSADTNSIDYKVTNAASNGGGHVQTANKGGTGQTSFNKGDILVASNSSTLGKLAVGTDGYAIIADSTQTSGLNYGQVLTASAIQNQTAVYGVGSVISASVYGVQITPIPSALSAGQAFEIKWPTTNAGSILALSVSSLVAARLVNPDLTNPEVGTIKASMISRVEYDGSQFQISSYTHNVGTSAKQLVQLDGTGALPAVSAANLTNLPAQGQWTKISTVTISQACGDGALTKISEWTSLTGDTDDIYWIDFEINSPQSSASANDLLALRINDDSTASHYGFSNLGITSNSATAVNAVSAGVSTEYRIVGGSTNIVFYYLSGTVHIKASKTIAGGGRTIMSDAIVQRDADASKTRNERGGGAWSDTSTQVISLQLYFIQNSGVSSTVVGKATLYKINR